MAEPAEAFCRRVSVSIGAAGEKGLTGSGVEKQVLSNRCYQSSVVAPGAFATRLTSFIDAKVVIHLAAYSVFGHKDSSNFYCRPKQFGVKALIVAALY